MSGFRYGQNFWGQKYLSVSLNENGERVEVDEEILKGDFDRLIISSGTLDNIEFLSDVAIGLKRLTIQSGVKSLSGLERLTDLLEFDCDNTGERPYPDYGKLVNLETCVLAWSKKYDAAPEQNRLFTLPKLRDLTLRYWAKQDCSEIAQLVQLERLDFRQGALVRLDGIKNCAKLKALELSYLPKLADISGVSASQNLERIHIENCPNIGDLIPVVKLKNLRLIHFEKINYKFKDLNWLMDAPHVEKICLGCEILKIDWSILFSHPTLSDVALKSHEGYTATDAEILKFADTATRKVVNFKRRGTKKLPSFTFNLE